MGRFKVDVLSKTNSTPKKSYTLSSKPNCGELIMVTIEQLEADVKTLPFAEIKKLHTRKMWMTCVKVHPYL